MPFVSTGELPSPSLVRKFVDETYDLFKGVGDGRPSTLYPALARVPAHLFGLCAAGVSGLAYAAGDADHGFALMSVAKPFVFALVCEALGAGLLRERLGVNATGLPFNSLTAVERGRAAAPTRWSTRGRSARSASRPAPASRRSGGSCGTGCPASPVAS
ncbi:glutaminase [Paractinoplanes durhamensis]|uniref:glutaminase n=1 Tax=Paractinoplanes durhamensis TaxID=113563 RepID=UPI0036298A2B